MFIQVIQGRCSRPQELRAVAEGWRGELGAGADGFLGGTYGFTDDGLFVGVVRFASREQAMANSARPEQDAWAQRFAATFDGEMEFRDYDRVETMLAGGSDDAGFVQVIQGRTDDLAAVDTLIASADAMREMRSEIIGATWGIAPDGSFTETVAFTSEAAARSGESGDPPPPEVAAALATVLAGATFLDLRAPWFESA
jgi:hypothetical protein